MKLILFNLNWSQNREITLLNVCKYCFSGGWIIKSSSWLLIKKVLKEVPFSRLNSSSNLSLFWSKNLTQEKFSVISNSDKFWFYASKPILISDILKTYFLVLICDLLVVEKCHIDFQRIFNYRPEHLVLVKPLFINRLYL